MSCEPRPVRDDVVYGPDDRPALAEGMDERGDARTALEREARRVRAEGRPILHPGLIADTLIDGEPEPPGPSPLDLAEERDAGVR